jgi:hypothetical protein
LRLGERGESVDLKVRSVGHLQPREVSIFPSEIKAVAMAVSPGPSSLGEAAKPFSGDEPVSGDRQELPGPPGADADVEPRADQGRLGGADADRGLGLGEVGKLVWRISGALGEAASHREAEVVGSDHRGGLPGLRNYRVVFSQVEGRAGCLWETSGKPL